MTEEKPAHLYQQNHGRKSMTDTTDTEIRDEFSVRLLNSSGVQKARKIAEVYSNALNDLEELCGVDGREMAIVRTKMQESAFFAKRAMAVRPENQQ